METTGKENRGMGRRDFLLLSARRALRIGRMPRPGRRHEREARAGARRILAPEGRRRSRQGPGRLREQVRLHRRGG